VCGTRNKRGNVSAVEPPALTGHFSGLQFWGRVSDPTGRFERPMIGWQANRSSPVLKPPALRGDTYYYIVGAACDAG
jgi:hypothetical protein